MNDDCPLCGGGFYAGICINGYHPWAWSEHKPWPKLNLHENVSVVNQEKDGSRNLDKNLSDAKGQ